MGLVLASASPRRADLLRAAGFDFEIAPADVDESICPGESADEYVARLARQKAEAVGRRFAGDCVIAADTAVVVDGTILGKPADAADAARMLRLLSGRTHEVLTGVALRWMGRHRVRMERSRVEFEPLSEGDVASYVASGEPFDKAGGYAIQGLASRFTRVVDGPYDNVVGLPVGCVRDMLADLGWAGRPEVGAN